VRQRETKKGRSNAGRLAILFSLGDLCPSASCQF